MAVIGHLASMGRTWRALQNAGPSLHVDNRTGKGPALVDAGATWHNLLGTPAAVRRVVITMLGFPVDVDQTLPSEKGGSSKTAKADAPAGSTCDLAPRLARRGVSRRLH